MRQAGIAAGLVCTAILAGCATEGSSLGLQDRGIVVSLRAPVIALLDGGANPYADFLVEPSPDYVGRQLSGFREVQITDQGGPVERLKADQELLASLEPNVLYHFKGTRLLAISMDEVQPEGEHMTLDSGHGQGTSYLAARESRDAIIVMVQVDLGVCSETPGCLVDSSIADGMEWIADQPWIDVVSISVGFPGNPPFVDPVNPEMARYLEASKKAADSGKIIVTAAGNVPSPPLTSYFVGPPWIIAVGGAEGDSRGENVLSAKTFDVHANFSERVPVSYSGDTAWQAGTSLSTPIVAGTLASALQSVWQQDAARNVTAQELRAALNATAIVFNPTEWQAGPRDRGESPAAMLYATTSPVLTPVQSGWGYVDGAISTEIARRIIEKDLSAPEKAAIEAYQSEWQALRSQYWAAWLF